MQEIRIGHRREAIQEETDAKQEVKGLKRKYIPYTFENGDTRKELLARRRHLLFKSLKSGVNHRKSEPKILFKEYPVHQKSIMSGFRDASARIRPPCWRNCSLTKGQTALTDYRHGKKETKREDIPVLTGISSLTWKKGGYLLSRFAGSTIGVSGLNFSVRNGKRWDTAAIATIISDSGIHAAQHYIGKRRIIPLTSNQQNIKKQTGMYMKKHPCEKKYRVPDKSFRAISSARLWRRRLYTCTLSTSSSLTTLIKEI